MTTRFKRLRTPDNVFVINLTLCDFLSCFLHPLSIYSTFRGRWSFGQTGTVRGRPIMSYCVVKDKIRLLYLCEYRNLIQQALLYLIYTFTDSPQDEETPAAERVRQYRSPMRYRCDGDDRGMMGNFFNIELTVDVDAACWHAITQYFVDTSILGLFIRRTCFARNCISENALPLLALQFRKTRRQRHVIK